MTRAVQVHEAGDPERAIPLYRDALARDGEDIDALRLFGVALAQTGRLGEAEAHARRAVVLAPGYALAWSNLGTVLNEANRPEEAVEAFEHACAIEPRSPHVWFNLGNALSTAGNVSGAIEAYERALTLEPDHGGAKVGIAHMLKTIGRTDEARTAYADVLAQDPGNGHVWWSLANLKTHRFSDADVAAMEAALAPPIDDSARAAILFSLAKAADDRRDSDRAFAFYEKGNALQRTLVRYDPVQTEQINDRIVSVFDSNFFAARAGWGHDDPAPIFIVGLPRSGSTLIEQILASHSAVEGTAELPDLGRLAMSIGRFRSDGVGYPEAVRDIEAADARALGRTYIARTQRHRTGKRFFTDKMPNNFPTIGLAHLMLPNATIIDARRHPMAACVGCYRQLFAQGQTFSYDLFELAEYYREYDRMMRWWDQMLPGRVLRVDYELLVTDQERQTRRLLDHVGLPWEDGCLDFHRTERAVKTASSEQVRQPLYTDGLQSWRRYGTHLAPLEAQLADILAEVPEAVRMASDPDGRQDHPSLKGRR